LPYAFGIASGVSPEQGLMTIVFGGFLFRCLGIGRARSGASASAFIVVLHQAVQDFWN